MDVLVFFKRIRSEEIELYHIKEQRDTLRNSLLPAAIRYDRDKVQTSPADHMLEVVTNLNEIDGKLAKRAAVLSRHINLAHEIVSEMVTPECQELIELRYLDRWESFRMPMRWTDIADRMGYSLDHVQGKLHSKAIKEARQVWKSKGLQREQF